MSKQNTVESLFGDGSDGELIIESTNQLTTNYFCFPLQVSKLMPDGQFKSGHLSNDGHHIIWNDDTVSCLDCDYQDSKSAIDEFDKELALEAINDLSLSKNNGVSNTPAICTKCNYINEYQPEDPNYICYKCKNF